MPLVSLLLVLLPVSVVVVSTCLLTAHSSNIYTKTEHHRVSHTASTLGQAILLVTRVFLLNFGLGNCPPNFHEATTHGLRL